MEAAFYKGDKTIAIGRCVSESPGPGQVQIAVSHCGICGTDLHIYLGHMDARVRMPQILGHEMAGTIAAVGPNVDGWHEGDRVTVRPLDACGQCPACKAGHDHICMNLKFLGIDTPGAMQEFWTVPASTLHRLPEQLSFEHGALIEPIAVAAHDVRLGEVQSGEFVVVQGAGPIGLLIALVARLEGARVLISEVNPFRLKLAQELGLETIDPTKADVVERVEALTDGAGADVVFEVSGSAAGAEMMTKLPRTRGRIVVVAIFAKAPQIDLFRFFWRELRLCGTRVYEPQDFDRAIEMTASGQLPLERVVSQVIDLHQLADSFEQLEQGSDLVKVLVRCHS